MSAQFLLWFICDCLRRELAAVHVVTNGCCKMLEKNLLPFFTLAASLLHFISNLTSSRRQSREMKLGASVPSGSLDPSARKQKNYALSLSLDSLSFIFTSHFLLATETSSGLLSLWFVSFLNRKFYSRSGHKHIPWMPKKLNFRQLISVTHSLREFCIFVFLLFFVVFFPVSLAHSLTAWHQTPQTRRRHEFDWHRCT